MGVLTSGAGTVSNATISVKTEGAEAVPLGRTFVVPPEGATIAYEGKLHIVKRIDWTLGKWTGTYARVGATLHLVPAK